MVVKVIGGGTMATSLSVKCFLLTAFDANLDRVVFDLTECSYLDSTFMGVLVWAARLAATRASGWAKLVGVHDRVRSTLGAMNLEQVMDISEEPMTEELHLRALPIIEGPPEVRHIYEAHEALASLCPANRERFARLLEILEAEQKCPEDAEKDSPHSR